MWVTWVTADDDADAFGRHTAGTTWTRHVPTSPSPPPSSSSVCSIINNDDDEDDDGCPLAVAVGDAVVQVCECLWSAVGHASLGYGSGRSININIIATACAITCDINDAAGWGRGRECQRDGRTCPSLGHVYKLPFGAALARSFGAFDTRLSALQICSSVSLYLSILYLVSCILYLVSVYLVSALRVFSHRRFLSALCARMRRHSATFHFNCAATLHLRLHQQRR